MITDESGGLYHVVLQGDGNLVVRRRDGQTIAALGADPAHPWSPAPDPVQPPPSTGRPLSGRLRTDGRGYRDNTGYVIPRAVHLGDLALSYIEGEDQLVHQALADCRDAGYQIIRTWLAINWNRDQPFWGDRKLAPTRTPEYWRRITELLRIGADDYGLQWHTALGDSLDVTDLEEDVFWRWVAGLVAERPPWFALIEGLNEATGTGDRDDWDPAEVEQQIQIVRALNPNHLYALSAAAGTGSEERDELRRWTPDWMPTYYVHSSRAGHWGDQMRHAFSLGYEDPVRRLGWSGEPPGVNRRPYYDGGRTGPGAWVSVMDRPQDWYEHPYRYALYLAMTAMARQVPTYMSSPGVILADGQLADQPAFWQAADLLRELPADLMTWDRLFHGGTTWAAERVIAAGDGYRADHAIDTATGRAMAIVYPQRDGIDRVTLPVDRRFTGRRWDGVRWADVDLAAGARWQTDVSDGLLLLGEVDQ